MDSIETGNLITQLRKERHLTQNDLANMLNVTNKAISRWETGEGYPDLYLLPKLAAILNVTVDELLAGKTQSKPVINRFLWILVKSIPLLFVVFVVGVFFLINHWTSPNLSTRIISTVGELYVLIPLGIYTIYSAVQTNKNQKIVWAICLYFLGAFLILSPGFEALFFSYEFNCPFVCLPYYNEHVALLWTEILLMIVAIIVPFFNSKFVFLHNRKHV